MQGHPSLFTIALPANTPLRSDLWENKPWHPAGSTLPLSLCELITWNQVCFAPTWLVRRKHVALFQHCVAQCEQRLWLLNNSRVWPGLKAGQRFEIVAESDWSYINVKDVGRERFFVFWSIRMQIRALWKSVWETVLPPLCGQTTNNTAEHYCSLLLSENPP